MKIKLLDKKAKMPTRGSTESAGLDLYSIEDVFIPVGSTVKIRTGIAVHFNKGLVMKIEDRSGLAAKGLRTGAGIVDQDYFPGEIKVVMHNLTNRSSKHNDQEGYWVKEGDRIAQFLLFEVKMYEPVLWTDKDTYERSERIGGFGSTGR